jgi:nitrite reductase/ring-hydroxylating ferredoxin subunit/DMSO/TMAO reductase YedYZ heme-binding membrane subunit
LSDHYVPVSWNRTKVIYDAVLVGAIALYLGTYLGWSAHAPADGAVSDPQAAKIKALGSCAFLLMTCAVAIGPLARIDRRFLPLLYNRRHLGVATFLVAFTHALAVVDWYFAYSPTPPLTALLSSEPAPGSAPGLPFVLFGIAALAVLFLLASTSHDFWLRFFGPPAWKALHMAIYPAYLAVVTHVAFGYLQSADDPAFAAIVSGSALGVGGLHVAAAWASFAAETVAPPAEALPGWLCAGAVADIPDNRAIVLRPPTGENIAIFRHDGRLSAVSNVCKHQNGPLGEGAIVDGCITCPWHGFQYRPEDGCAPPPFTERLATYNLQIVGGAVYVDPRPNPPGTHVQPAVFGDVPT